MSLYAFYAVVFCCVSVGVDVNLGPTLFSGSRCRFIMEITMDPTFGLVGGLIGAGVNYFGQQQTNQMQAQMMQQQNQFQEHMSSTAYQRASKDMQAAGLNPMMMFSQGSAASSPSGAAPSTNVKSGLDADSMQKGVSTALQSAITEKTISKMAEEIANLTAERNVIEKRPDVMEADIREKGSVTELNRERAKTERYNTLARKYGLAPIKLESESAEHMLDINSGKRAIADKADWWSGKGRKILMPVHDVVHSASDAIRAVRGTRRLRRTEKSNYGDTIEHSYD